MSTPDHGKHSAKIHFEINKILVMVQEHLLITIVIVRLVVELLTNLLKFNN